MPLEEYLFVDDQRLDAYVDQLGSPVTYDKVPVWEARFSLTGPEASGTQERHARALTRTEKIGRLVEYLEKHDQLLSGRPTGREVFHDNTTVFRLESCRASRVLIPALSPEDIAHDDTIDKLLAHSLETTPAPGDSTWLRLFVPLYSQLNRQRRARHIHERRLQIARQQLQGFGGINLWVSDRRREGGTAARRGGGQLLLVAGFPRDDERHFHAWSAYSALACFLHELRADVDRTVLRSFAGDMHNQPSSFQDGFLADPAATLAEAGASVSPGRAITTLYRIREAVLYRDPADGAEAIATFAYPIFIRAAA